MDKKIQNHKELGVTRTESGFFRFAGEESHRYKLDAACIIIYAAEKWVKTYGTEAELRTLAGEIIEFYVTKERLTALEKRAVDWAESVVE